MRKFGIEIELIGLDKSRTADILTAAGISAYDVVYTHAVSRSWKVVTDRSVGSRGCEVVSPVLEGEDGLDQVKRVMIALDQSGAGVNRSCGLHVHIEARGFSGAQLATIVARYGRYEAEIDSFMPPSRRGSANSFCRSVAGLNIRGESGVDAVNSMSGRYYKVNLQSYIKYGTVEFRQHSGTLNWNKAVNWIKFLQAFVEESVSLAPVPARNEAPVMPRLNVNERRVMEILSSGYHTPQAVSDMMDNRIAPSSVRAVMTTLRREGYRVHRLGRPGFYRYSVTDHPAPRPVMVHPSRTDQGLWAGVPEEVKNFYATRAAAFAAGE